MASTEVYGTEPLLMSVRQGCRLLLSSAQAMMRSLVQQGPLRMRGLQPYTGVSRMQSITKSSGAGTLTKSTVWKFLRTSDL